MNKASRLAKNHILVIGADGYIGTVLYEKLTSSGYKTTGIDTCFYSDALLYPMEYKITIHNKDTRDITAIDFSGIDIVFCLADLTDPISQKYPEVAKEINVQTLKMVADLAKQEGVKRFIYSSSASVYGFASDKLMTEDSQLNPLTPYAEAKVEMEKYLLSISDKDFNICCMRNATVYGLSPRMRFDLVVNYISGTAVALKEIQLKSDGEAWRPFVHIEDVTDVFIAVMHLDDAAFNNLIINVGNTHECYKINEVAEIVKAASGCDISINRSLHDGRSYKIDCHKLNKLGIHCNRQLRNEVSKLVNYFEGIGLDEKTMMRPSFLRMQQIDNLIESKKINERLQWI